MPARLVHLQIAARDADRLGAFYEQVCGWRARDVTDRYRMLHDPETGVSIGIAAEGETPFVPALAVGDLDEFLVLVEAPGGTRLSDPVIVPGIGPVASFRDPEGQPGMIVPDDQPGEAGPP
jgi:predicted enzyme related to lactoylglutathione lyase